MFLVVRGYTQSPLIISTNIKPLLLVDAASWGNAYPNAIVNCPDLVGKDDRLLEHGLDKIPLDVLRDDTVRIVLDILDEISVLFPSKHIHLGGDEVDQECWLHSELVRNFKHKHGRNWHKALHSKFLMNTANHLASQHGKHIILWDEALDLPALPTNTKIQVWRWWLKGQFRRAHRKNFESISSVGYYLDYLNTKWQDMYDRSISPHATGGEACSWHEHADTATIEHRIFQRLPVVAERLWGNAKLNKNERTLPRLAWVLCRLKKLRGLRVASVFPDYCPVTPVTGQGCTMEKDSMVFEVNQ